MSYEELQKLIGKEKIEVSKKHIITNKETYRKHSKTAKYKWYRPAKYIRLFNKWVNPDKNIIINMELDNGENISFLIDIYNTSFKFKERLYIVDLSMQYYSLSAKLYCLDYHQSFSLPIRRKIDVSKIKDAIDEKNLECRNATNPSNLRKWMESSSISKIFYGADLQNKIEFLTILGYISIVVLVLILAGLGYLIYYTSQIGSGMGI